MHPEAALSAAVTPACRTGQGLRHAAAAVVLALVALGLAWELWLAPTGRGTLALKVLPLLLALPGLWQGRLQAHRAVALLVWLYMLEALLRGTTERGIVVALATAEGVLALALFTLVTLHIRRAARRGGPPA